MNCDLINDAMAATHSAAVRTSFIDVLGRSAVAWRRPHRCRRAAAPAPTTFAETAPIEAASDGQAYVKQARPYLDFIRDHLWQQVGSGPLKGVRALAETEKPLRRRCVVLDGRQRQGPGSLSRSRSLRSLSGHRRQSPLVCPAYVGGAGHSASDRQAGAERRVRRTLIISGLVRG